MKKILLFAMLATFVTASNAMQQAACSSDTEKNTANTDWHAAFRMSQILKGLNLSADTDLNVLTQLKKNGVLLTAASKNLVYSIKLLLELNADINAKDTDGKTPLHYATYNGHTDVVRLLIKYRADVNARGNDGNTPLHNAALKGATEIVQLLLKGGANIKAITIFEQTPLHMASKTKVTEVVRLLLATVINAKDFFNKTALHYAALNGNIAAVQELLAADADVNARSNRGNTPLHYAALKGHTDVVQALLANKADINAKNNDGNTPLQLATSEDVKELLHNASANESTCSIQ